jgi:hypothetical protein
MKAGLDQKWRNFLRLAAMNSSNVKKNRNVAVGFFDTERGSGAAGICTLTINNTVYKFYKSKLRILTYFTYKYYNRISNSYCTLEQL